MNFDIIALIFDINKILRLIKKKRALILTNRCSFVLQAQNKTYNTKS